jgi:hypothetical protein
LAKIPSLIRQERLGPFGEDQEVCRGVCREFSTIACT